MSAPAPIRDLWQLPLSEALAAAAKPPPGALPSKQLIAMHRVHGPCEGQWCGDCYHLKRERVFTYTDHERIYFKCRRYGSTKGEGSDWRLRWPACGAFDDDADRARRMADNDDMQRWAEASAAWHAEMRAAYQATYGVGYYTDHYARPRKPTKKNPSPVDPSQRVKAFEREYEARNPRPEEPKL